MGSVTATWPDGRAVTWTDGAMPSGDESALSALAALPPSFRLTVPNGTPVNTGRYPSAPDAFVAACLSLFDRQPSFVFDGVELPGDGAEPPGVTG